MTAAIEPGRVPQVLGIGELVWDLLPAGPRLGGAPFNTVAHLARFGCASRYVTAIGRDELGTRAIDAMRGLGVSTSLVQVSDRPTGLVRVRLDAAGVPDFEIVTPAAYEEIVPLDGDDLDVASRVDALVFGTLAQRAPRTLEATRGLVDVASRAIRLYDVNLRPGAWDAPLVATLIPLATVIKLNEDERQALADAFDLPAWPIERFARAAAARYGLRGVCVTRGAAGAALLLDDVYGELASPRVDVVDTVGAGDAFAGGLVYGLLNGWLVPRILDLATRLGALVASRAGAIPDWNLAELGLVARPLLVDGGWTAR